MQELVRKDKREGFNSRNFPYLEFDVQETRDGKVSLADPSREGVPVTSI